MKQEQVIKTLSSTCNTLANDLSKLLVEYMYLKKKSFSTVSGAINPVIDTRQTERIVELKKDVERLTGENEEVKKVNGELCAEVERLKSLMRNELAL